MIKIEKLYRETNAGLDIILYYYPQARECVNTKKKFKVREKERTPSATILSPDQKHDYYRVCDFGDDGHALSPIDICMKEESISSHRFNEAVLKLAARHNVADELNRSINKPRIEQRPALPTEKEGDRPFKLLKKIPDYHLSVFGPKVTHEHTDFLHWHEAEYVGYVKDGKATLKYSTEDYPIFMRECVTDEEKVFYKIYEPLNPEKGFRFSYAPSGIKPKQFINGFREMLQAIELENTMKEPDDKPTEKLQEAFICSGERDAICCLSMGGHPLWFNSETYDLQKEEYDSIMEHVEKLYNIPDIDSTGRKKGTQLALKFMDIRTMWLPDWLLDFKDNRGKPRKDLRDWMELRSMKSDFGKLKNTAMQAKFWDYARNSKTGKDEYSISSVRLYYFLQLNGYYALRDENSDTPRYIYVDGNVVTAVRARDVRKFVRLWAETSFLREPVRNLIATSMKFSESALENLKEVELDFTNYTPTTQTMFFSNMVAVITPTDIKVYRKGECTIDNYVWKENVIEHTVRLLPPLFNITRKEAEDFDIELVSPQQSPFLGYLINSSRLHWRKEMELRFLIDGESEEALQRMEEYKKSHRFCLDGEGLSDLEIADQKQCLLNKLFSIGYLLHHHKSPSRPWAPIAMDNKIGEQGECNGRSGKSFLFRTLAMFMKSVTLSGRNPHLMDNPHVFDQVNKDTDLILVDDCAQYLPMGLFYDLITSDMTVNPKNNKSFTIPFSNSPKFAFSTNFVPADFDSSSVARSLYIVFSDYYHEKSSQNDYRESRRISDDFGMDLFSNDYTEEQWNADINVLLQCLQFYLSLVDTNVKILPPMDNILHRKFLQDMGANFQDWAEMYFAKGGEHLDKFVVRKEAFDAFRLYSNNSKITMQSFSKKLKAFCDVTPYIDELNPVELQNSQGRIMKYFNNVQQEVIFIRSVKDPEPETPKEPDLFDASDDDDDERPF